MEIDLETELYFIFLYWKFIYLIAIELAYECMGCWFGPNQKSNQIRNNPIFLLATEHSVAK